MFGMGGFRVEFLSGGLWLTVLLGLAFLTIVYLYYRRTTPPLNRTTRWVLIGLRAVACLALFLALAQPILTFSTSQQFKKRLAVLLDRSRSMTLPLSGAGGQSRLDKAAEVLRSPELAPMRDNLAVDYFAFAESLAVSQDGRGLSGKLTDYERALAQLRQMTPVNSYDYMLLVSDGRVTLGENLADLGSQSGTLILALAVGDSSRIEDVSLDRVDYNDVMYAGRPTEITVAYSQRGAAAGDLQVQLSEGAKVLAQKAIPPPGDGRSGEGTLTFTPSSPGRIILDLTIAASTNETNRQNNRQKFSVRVLKSKLRVLLYSSSINQEYAFLNRFLTGRADYEVVPVIDAAGGDRIGTRFPDTQEKLNSFDVVIMIDPDLGRLSSHYDRFKTYLADRGGAILLFMGEVYAGSAAGSRLESLFPLAVTSGRNRLPHYGKYHLRPDPRMIFHPSLKLAETREDIAAVWASQPPFTAVAPIDSVRADGVALAYLEGEGDRLRGCAMAMRQVRAGKVLAIAVAPFWHWAFFPVGVGAETTPYRNFLSGAIRWLTAGDESDRISLKPVKEVFQNGEAVAFAGTAYDEGFRPIENAAGDLIVVSDKRDSSSARILPDPLRPGKYAVPLGALAPGTYSYRAAMMAETVRLGSFEGKFAVDDIDREIAFGDVDWTAMQAAARNSRGLFASYKNPAALLDKIDLTRVIVRRGHEIRLWDNLVLLLIIIGALSLEWIIRKQRQLL